MVMDKRISAGDTCIITRDISIEGRPAFQKGEWVKVEMVEPDPQRPEHRFVTRSQFLQSWVKLTGSDLEVRYQALPAVAAPGTAYVPSAASPLGGASESAGAGRLRSSPAFLPVVMVVAVAIALAGFAAVYFVTREEEDIAVDAGWKMHEGGGVKLSLPDNYEVGSGDEMDSMVKSMKSLGSDYEAMAEMVAANPEMFRMWAYDPEVGNDGFMTNVTVVAEPIPSGITLESYIRAATSMLPEEMRIVEQDVMPVGEYEAARWVMETTMMGSTIKQLSYAMKGDKEMYIVTFTTSLNDFNKLLPDFEKSIESFRH